jgi:hypothetical protein
VKISAEKSVMNEGERAQRQAFASNETCGEQRCECSAATNHRQQIEKKACVVKHKDLLFYHSLSGISCAIHVGALCAYNY